jgi:hypothetical protein
MMTDQSMNRYSQGFVFMNSFFVAGQFALCRNPFSEKLSSNIPKSVALTTAAVTRLHFFA